MNFKIRTLGEAKYNSPMIGKVPDEVFISDDKRTRFYTIIDQHSAQYHEEHSFELAGAREKIYFDPKETRPAIVTCGGLCPGLNDVIRSIVMGSYYSYGIKSVLGIKYGYTGLNPKNGFDPIELTPDIVKSIHKQGGSILGSARGGTENIELLVDTLMDRKVNILFTIGGDGTLRGAHKINNIAKDRGYDLSVIGIPKTIDNDISFIQRSFGFETAFSKAVEAISTAHAEATGAFNGIGLVKLMGRHSGFIAANASLAMNDANYVLIPEVPFELYGKKGFLNHLENRLKERGHAVICVAEGAGQNLIEEHTGKTDESGNIRLKDIGGFLKDRILEHFKEKNTEITLKYIDPSYIIRSAPANPQDSLFCLILGRMAVHAAMAGKTDMIVGRWNNIYTHVPIELAVSERKTVKPKGKLWSYTVEGTGQPYNMIND